MSNLFTWCIKEHTWQIHATLYPNKTSEDSNPCGKSPLFWQLQCKWWVKSSWHAWVSPPGHSPLGSSTSFVSGAGRQECASHVRMNKCSSVTIPHVKEEGALSRTQLDSPNWRVDHTHLHMSHSAAASCMFHHNGGQSRIWIIISHKSFRGDHEAGGIISAMKLSDSSLLKGKSNRNASGCAVISRNDLSLIVSLNHLSVLSGAQYVDKAWMMIVLKPYSASQAPWAGGMTYIWESPPLLRNGLSMSEVITLINF